MSKINFEEDQQEVIQKTGNLQTLADQVQMLEGVSNRIDISEKNLKDLKKEYERLSGEVIPTMMAEMGLAHLKLMDGSSVDCLLYTSPSPRDRTRSRMPSSA